MDVKALQEQVEELTQKLSKQSEDMLASDALLAEANAKIQTLTEENTLLREAVNKSTAQIKELEARVGQNDDLTSLKAKVASLEIEVEANRGTPPIRQGNTTSSDLLETFSKLQGADRTLFWRQHKDALIQARKLT